MNNQKRFISPAFWNPSQKKNHCTKLNIVVLLCKLQDSFAMECSTDETCHILIKLATFHCTLVQDAQFVSSSTKICSVSTSHNRKRNNSNQNSQKSKRTMNTNVNIITSVYKGFINEIVLFSIVLRITIEAMFLMVKFDTYLEAMVITLNNTTIEITLIFNGYNDCCNCILNHAQFENGSRKLIKFSKNCFLWCITCFIDTICIIYSLLLIIIIRQIKNGTLCKLCNFVSIISDWSKY